MMHEETDFHDEELESLKKQLTTRKRNLLILRETEAKYGSIVPASIMYEMKEHEKKIGEIEKRIEYLQRLLGKETSHQVDYSDETAVLADANSDKFSRLPLYNPEYTHTEQFFGRVQQLHQLDEWFASNTGMMVVEGIGGQGKSALVWEWLQRIVETTPHLEGVIWWGCYGSNSSLEHFSRSMLAYIWHVNVHDQSISRLTYSDVVNEIKRSVSQDLYVVVIDGLERRMNSYMSGEAAYQSDSKASSRSVDRMFSNPDDDACIQMLRTLIKSKIILCSRLMPTSLDSWTRTNKVAVMQLPGMTAEDGEAFMRFYGVRRAKVDELRLFMAHIGYHPLIMKLAAGEIANYIPARGNFDRWRSSAGGQVIAQLMGRDAQHEIIGQVFNRLEALERDILHRLAAFGVPISLETIMMVFQPPLPPPSNLPERVRTRPHPFGSPALARIKRQLASAETFEERARLQAAFDQQEAEDIVWMEDVAKNRQQYEQRAQANRLERQRIIKQHYQDYLRSDAYQQIERPVCAALERLKAHHLVEASGDEEATYDLHPVIRGYVMETLDDATKQRAFTQALDHMSGMPIFRTRQFASVNELEPLIILYHIQRRAGKYADALRFYNQYLYQPLRDFGAATVEVELLEPLFPHGLEQEPVVNLPDGYIYNRLALALTDVGRCNHALLLEGYDLRPNQNTTLNKLIITIGNYASSLVRLGRMLEAEHTLRIADSIIGATNTYWALARWTAFFISTGQKEKVSAALQKMRDAKPSTWEHQVWKSWYYRLSVESLLAQSQDATQILNEWEPFVLSGKALPQRREWLTFRARTMLLQGRVLDAEICIVEAIKIARTNRHLHSIETSIAALIACERGRELMAIEQIEHAVTMPTRSVEQRINILLNATAIYMKLDDKAKATEYALESYRLAWSEGPPYCFAFLLEQAKIALSKLDSSIPVLPIQQNTIVPSIPYETEVRRKITELQQTQSQVEGEATEFSDGADVTFDKVTWFQMGLMASFGIEDKDMLLRLATRLTFLNSEPAPIYFSRRGDTDPLPEPGTLDAETLSLGDIGMSYSELIDLKNVLIFSYIEGTDEQGRKQYLYNSMLLHRALEFIADKEAGKLLQMREYNASVVLYQYGDLSIESRQLMEEKYLFTEHAFHVRIFPSNE